MKTIKLVFFVVLLATLSFCEEQQVDKTNLEEKSDITLVRDDDIYQNTLSAISEDGISDPFTINSVTIDDQKLKMFIEVSYAGGCKKHEFNLVWPDAIIAIYPPQFSIILNHDANGDNCEAYLTELLEIDLKDNNWKLDDQSIRDMSVTIINGSNPDEKVVNK